MLWDPLVSDLTQKHLRGPRTWSGSPDLKATFEMLPKGITSPTLSGSTFTALTVAEISVTSWDTRSFQTPIQQLGKPTNMVSSIWRQSTRNGKCVLTWVSHSQAQSDLPQTHSWKGRKTDSESESISSVILTECQNNKHAKQTGQKEQVINQNTCGNRTSLGLKKRTLFHKLAISTGLSLPPCFFFFFYLSKKIGTRPKSLIRNFFPYCTCLSKSPSAVICY